MQRKSQATNKNQPLPFLGLANYRSLYASYLWHQKRYPKPKRKSSRFKKTQDSSDQVLTMDAQSMGSDGTMVISAPGAAYPLEHYSVWEYDLANPGDIDGDGTDCVRIRRHAH